MELKDDFQLSATRDKLRLLEERLSASRMENGVDPYLRDLSERSLKRHINRLREEISRYEAHRGEKVAGG